VWEVVTGIGFEVEVILTMPNTVQCFLDTGVLLYMICVQSVLS